MKTSPSSVNMDLRFLIPQLYTSLLSFIQHQCQHWLKKVLIITIKILWIVKISSQNSPIIRWTSFTQNQNPIKCNIYFERRMNWFNSFLKSTISARDKVACQRSCWNLLITRLYISSARKAHQLTTHNCTCKLGQRVIIRCQYLTKYSLLMKSRWLPNIIH